MHYSVASRSQNSMGSERKLVVLGSSTHRSSIATATNIPDALGSSSPDRYWRNGVRYPRISHGLGKRVSCREAFHETTLGGWPRSRHQFSSTLGAPHLDSEMWVRRMPSPAADSLAGDSISSPGTPRKSLSSPHPSQLSTNPIKLKQIFILKSWHNPSAHSLSLK